MLLINESIVLGNRECFTCDCDTLDKFIRMIVGKTSLGRFFCKLKKNDVNYQCSYANGIFKHVKFYYFQFNMILFFLFDTKHIQLMSL